jgi:hypothetical protein
MERTERVVRVYCGVLVDVVDATVCGVVERLPLKRIEKAVPDDGVTNAELGENDGKEVGKAGRVASAHVVFDLLSRFR